MTTHKRPLKALERDQKTSFHSCPLSLGSPWSPSSEQVRWNSTCGPSPVGLLWLEKVTHIVAHTHTHTHTHAPCMTHHSNPHHLGIVGIWPLPPLMCAQSHVRNSFTPDEHKQEEMDPPHQEDDIVGKLPGDCSLSPSINQTLLDWMEVMNCQFCSRLSHTHIMPVSMGSTKGRST